MSASNDMVRRISVVGAGAWGTALALVASRAAEPVTLWAYEAEVANLINARHGNPFLDGILLPPVIKATSELADAAAADAVLLAVPAQHLRGICVRLAMHLRARTPLVICAKGIELKSGKLMSEVVTETCPQAQIAILSGPTFAAEVAAGRPTAVTIATANPAFGRALIDSMGSPVFRPYLSDDVIGTQIGGAVKNVIAIACGIVEGRDLGDNARAAVMTRGLAEIMRLGTALGGRRETLMGLSGLGDLALTCTGHQSRNMSLGIALGKGQSVTEALTGKRSVAEGVASSAAVSALGAVHGVEMPIVNAVKAILHDGAAIKDAIAGLLERPFRSEG
jgi:glycerol-3-phosphate dehydrogenase (NAD(P)+)